MTGPTSLSELKKFEYFILVQQRSLQQVQQAIRGYEAFRGSSTGRSMNPGPYLMKKYLEFLERAKVERKLNGVLLTSEKVAVQSKQFATKRTMLFFEGACSEVWARTMNAHRRISRDDASRRHASTLCKRTKNTHSNSIGLTSPIITAGLI